MNSKVFNTILHKNECYNPKNLNEKSKISDLDTANVRELQNMLYVRFQI